MNTKILAIVAVVILAGGAAGVVIMNMNNDDSSDKAISITDGSGRKIELDKPLSKVATINTNIPKAMIMLGLQDTIKCLHTSKDLPAIKGDNILGTYYTPSVETLLSYDVEAVLCPVSSMTLVAGTAKTCEENGIKVIRLDCYGDSLTEDIKKLNTLFGEPESAVKALDRYNQEYNALLNAVKNAISGKDKLNYLYSFGAFTANGSVINERSGLSEILAPFFEKNVTEYTDLAASVSGVSNPVDDGTKEALQEVQDKIDCFGIRLDLNPGTKKSPKTPVPDAEAAFAGYVGDAKIVTAESGAYKNNKVFVINTDLVSGLYGHIGVLIFVSQAYGVDVEGYTDLNKVISDFQAWTGLDMIENKELVYISFNNDGSHTDTKFAQP